MLTRLPLIQLRSEQRYRQRQSIADRDLDNVTMSGLISAGSKAEERSRPAASGLNVIDDQKNVPAFADALHGAQPAHAGRVQTALALHRFDDDGGRPVNAAGRVVDHLLEDGRRIDLFPEVAVEGHRCHTEQRHARRVPVMGITRGGHRTQRDAVESIGEGDDVVASGDVPRKLQCGLHRVSPGRAGKLNGVLQPAWLEDVRLQRLQKLLFRHGVHVEPVGDAIAGYIVEQCLLQHRMVVPIVERTGPGKKVQIPPPIGVVQIRALCLIENDRKRPRVALYV